VVCTSHDGGETFTEVVLDPGNTLDANVVFDGEQFVAFTEWPTYLRHTSVDGLVWSSTPMVDQVDLGSVAANPLTGTLVAESGGWMRWYDQQVMYRSDDAGLTWVALDASAFSGGHDLRDLQFGFVAPGGACP
jgi:hypothetical protein